MMVGIETKTRPCLMHGAGLFVDGSMADLTPRQDRFVQEYLIDLNATQAAIRAGYSARSAEVEGSRLLRNARVAEAVARAKAERSARLGLTADRVLEEIAAVAFARLGDFAEWGPGSFNLHHSHATDAEGNRVEAVDTRAVQAVTLKEVTIPTENGDIVKVEQGIKLHDKLPALVKLGQHIGMFADKRTISIEIKREAEALAQELGIPVEQVLSEAGITEGKP